MAKSELDREMEKPMQQVGLRQGYPGAPVQQVMVQITPVYEQAYGIESVTKVDPEPRDRAMSDIERNELDRIIREAGITPRVEGRTIRVTPDDFAKLRRWADGIEPYSGPSIADYSVVVDPEPHEHGTEK